MLQILILMSVFMAFQISSMIGDDDGGNQHNLFCDKWKKAHLHSVKSLYSDSDNTVLVTFNDIQQLNISCGKLNSIDFNISYLGLLTTNIHFLLDLHFDIRPLLNSFLSNENNTFVANHKII